MKALKQVGKPTLGSRLAVLACVGLLAFVGEARAGAGPTLTMTGGMGVPGGSVAATLSLSNSQDLAVSAAVDVLFDGDVLGLQFSDCSIDPRLSDSHELGGRVTGETPDQRLVIDVFVQGTPEVPPPLGDGDLATCEFMILPGVSTGTTSLELTDPLVADDQGMPIEGVGLVDGVIEIGEAVTPTPMGTPTGTVAATATETATGGVETPTPTATGGVDTPTPTIPQPTPTATEFVEPTATRVPANTPTPQFEENDDSCAIVPVSGVNPWRSLVLLIVPAILLWGRRRKP